MNMKFKEFIRTGVDALRSGQYKQVHELGDGDDYCAGQVLLVALNRGRSGMVNFDLCDLLHANGKDGLTLNWVIRWNDSGRTFVEIADELERLHLTDPIDEIELYANTASTPVLVGA